jgi:hypothetical protein
MSYHVTWKPAAEQHLADLWLNAPDRKAISAASDALEVDLRRDPLNVGESRAGRTRITFVGPLGFVFDVYPQAGQVIVKAVWRARP